MVAPLILVQKIVVRAHAGKQKRDNINFDHCPVFILKRRPVYRYVKPNPPQARSFKFSKMDFAALRNCISRYQ
jgi:hypothetical protein